MRCQNCQIVQHGEAEAARHHDGRALWRFCSATRNPMKENRVVLELLLPKPGGHVLSPDFGQIRRWAVIKMGLEDMRIKRF